MLTEQLSRCALYHLSHRASRSTTGPWQSRGHHQGRQCALADIISVCWDVVDER